MNSIFDVMHMYAGRDGCWRWVTTCNRTVVERPWTGLVARVSIFVKITHVYHLANLLCLMYICVYWSGLLHLRLVNLIYSFILYQYLKGRLFNWKCFVSFSRKPISHINRRRFFLKKENISMFLFLPYCLWNKKIVFNHISTCGLYYVIILYYTRNNESGTKVIAFLHRAKQRNHCMWYIFLTSPSPSCRLHTPLCHFPTTLALVWRSCVRSMQQEYWSNNKLTKSHTKQNLKLAFHMISLESIKVSWMFGR